MMLYVNESIFLNFLPLLLGLSGRPGEHYRQEEQLLSEKQNFDNFREINVFRKLSPSRENSRYKASILKTQLLDKYLPS